MSKRYGPETHTPETKAKMSASAHRRWGTLSERFWAKVEVTDSCWIWRGNIINGYGKLRYEKSHRPAHCIAYELLIGPIPEDQDLDHLCHNADMSCRGGPTCLHRRCVNPQHLEPTSRSVNITRGRIVTGPRKSHCKQGHPLIGDNLGIVSNGHRICRTCSRARYRRYHERRRLRRL